jgi:hypothetical protein
MTGFVQIKTFDDLDQHFDNTTDSKGIERAGGSMMPTGVTGMHDFGRTSKPAVVSGS